MKKMSSRINGPLENMKFWRENKTILREFKYFYHIIILAVVFSLLSALLEGAGVSLLLSFLQSLTRPDGPPFQLGIQWIDVSILGINESSTSRLIRISIFIVLITWFRTGSNYLGVIFTERSQFELLSRLRIQIFEQLQSLQLSYFLTTKSGELINTITVESERFRFVVSSVSFLMTRSLVGSVYFVSLGLISWQLSIVALLVFTIIGVGLSHINSRVRKAGAEVSRTNGEFTSLAIEFINGIRTVQASATQNIERSKFYKASSNITDASNRSVAAMAMVRPLAESIATTALILMMIFAFIVFVSNGTLQVSSLLTFFFVLFRLIPISQEINNSRTQINYFKGSADNIKNLLRREDKPYLENGARRFPGLTRSVNFSAVNFGYDSESLVLRDITLTIEQGKMTAFVGASGAGKTTLVDLIPRFYDPVDGCIEIDGVNLKSFDIDSLRRKISIVSQDTFVFNTTVWENIAYGIDNATQEGILEAARSANALEFIQAMPEGFNTVLGDRGVRLSGGQRQRLAIARALIRNPDILILDEATSALDSVSEQLIQDSLEKISVGRTVIAIAHRLSTIARADKIVVLEKGEIVEQGGYQALLEQRGKLWEYHNIQHKTSHQESSLSVYKP
jgi:ATP-binding cassette, subfamily B, bacterial MsbA